jgi:probable rRNA maturation factor
MKTHSESSAPPKIFIRNLQRKIPVDIAGLEEFAAKALHLCLQIRCHKRTRLKALTQIHILIVGNRRMSSLHRQFLGKLGPTDVLTFGHGEIFIDAAVARDQARQFGTSLGHELRLYIVHGLLHLHGFDDQNKMSARKMATTQKKILSSLSQAG